MYRSITALSCREHIISTPFVLGKYSFSYGLDEVPWISESWRLCKHLEILLILSIKLVLSIGSYKVACKLQCKSRKTMSKAWTLWPDGWAEPLWVHIVGSTIGQTKRRLFQALSAFQGQGEGQGGALLHVVSASSAGTWSPVLVQITLWRWQSNKGIIFLKCSGLSQLFLEKMPFSSVRGRTSVPGALFWHLGSWVLIALFCSFPTLTLCMIWKAWSP